MNAHTPFDANQDWTNPYCQNSSNDPMVDALLGNAYHVVRTVYCNLGNLKLIYDFLNQYGMVLGVQSEAELKALTTKAKYARIYGFSRAGDRQVTDYLYVEGDRTGILPDDTTATGSWITVATPGSNGGSTSSEEGAYIPWVYSNGSATGGETSINVPDGTVGVPFIIINGDMQYVGRGFEFNVDSLSVTLAQPLEEGDEVVFLLTGVPAVPDNPNVNDWVQINWVYNNGAAVGGEQVIAIPYTFQSIPAVYKNGLRLYKGLTTESYTADPDNQRILLTEPLATNDRLIVQIGGEAQVLEASDHTLQEVARATNVKDSEVILSTDSSQVLNGKKVIFDVVTQRIYGLPTLPTNVYINTVSNGQLTYSPGNITIDLEPAPGSQSAIDKVQANLDALTASGVATSHRGTLAHDLEAIDRRPDGYSNSFSAVLVTGKDIQLSTDITSESTLELSADYQVIQGVGGSLTNSTATSAVSADSITGLKIKDFRCVGSIVNGASTGNVAYAVSIVDCTNATVCGIDTSSYTGSVAATRVTDSVIRDVYSRANRYHSDVVAGGYGVLLQGCKRTLIDGINFEADSSKGDLGRHALYVSVVQSDGSFCEDIIAKNIIGRYSGVDDRNMWFINIRRSKRVLVDGFLLQGGNGGIALNTSDGEVIDTQIKNGHLQVLQYGSDAVYGISGTPTDNSLLNNLLISGVSFDMQTKPGVTATTNGIIPISLSCQRSRIENIKIAGNGASTPILLGSCSLLTIDGVTDTINAGSVNQPFLRFQGTCSDISVLNIDTPRDTMFFGLDNVTNLTVNWERFGRIVSNNGTINISDSNSLFSSVTSTGTGEITVVFKNHVTTNAVRNCTVTPASTAGFVCLPEVVGRNLVLRFYNSNGTLVPLASSIVSADIRLYS